MNEVLETERFLKESESCDVLERHWIDSMKRQLEENLWVGKKIHFEWFREKKLGAYRLYFFVNKGKGRALLIAFGSKKKQQRIIDHIWQNRARYLALLEK